MVMPRGLDRRAEDLPYEEVGLTNARHGQTGAAQVRHPLTDINRLDAPQGGMSEAGEHVDPEQTLVAVSGVDVLSIDWGRTYTVMFDWDTFTVVSVLTAEAIATTAPTASRMLVPRARSSTPT